MNDGRTTQKEKTDVGVKHFQRWRRLATFLLCLAIIAVSLGVADYLKKTSPQAQKRIPQKSIPRVETVALFPADHQVAVNGMGSVVPAREITLKSMVSGQIETMHPEFAAGGFIAKGESILKIDPRDYHLALASKESQLVNAQFELKMEMGHQEVAQREWALLNRGKPVQPNDAELALRKPQLAKARADLTAARAELEQARVDLSRTDIKAPFNAIVRTKHVDIGSQVTTQDALATLVGTDEYWIRVSLPVDRLQWIHIPSTRTETGAMATVRYRGYKRTGHVIRLLGDLETQGRMARILVSVKDPLGLHDPRPDAPPLLIGEYVRVEIQGNHLENIYRIPRGALRDGNTIWLVGMDDALQITPVDTVWRDERIVLIKNHLNAGDRLVVSDLAIPVNGMQVEVIPGNPSGDNTASGLSDGNDG